MSILEIALWLFLGSAIAATGAIANLILHPY